MVGYNPVKILINVLLPAPLCPNKAKISFLYKLKETPLSAFFPSSKILWIFFIFKVSVGLVLFI